MGAPLVVAAVFVALAVMFVALAVMFVVSARPIRESDCIRGAHPTVVLEACRNVQK